MELDEGEGIRLGQSVHRGEEEAEEAHLPS